MIRARIGAAFLALLAIAATPGAPANAPGEPQPLSAILSRAGAFVDSLERNLSQIVAAEDYQQTVLSGSHVMHSRSLQSEVFFIRVEEANAWMTVRNVLRVDGRPVRGSHDRIMEALSGSSPRHLVRLRALADEGARYNIGMPTRNFNDPILTLTFLDGLRRPRFAFEPAGVAAAEGTEVQRLRFDEQVRPTLIRNAHDGASIPARGAVDVAADGRVLRTELELDVEPRTIATIRVRFAPDPKLGLVVPTMMQEDYHAPAGGSDVSCTAVYTDFRRFETAVRILP